MNDDTTRSQNGRRLQRSVLNDTTDREPLETIAAEYAERCRLGERVAIEEYAVRFPELAQEIRELFPTIKAMEQLNAKRVMDAGTQSSVPEQLGDYRVIGEIARGGMGIVYEAEQITLGRRVAVKVLPQHALRREKDIRRFEREAQTAAKLHHSNIVPVFGVGQDEGHHYIVMQLIRGVGLDEILSETKRLVTGGPEHESITTGRSSTVKRSAIGLLDSELRRDSTSVNCAEETLISTSNVDESTRQTRNLSPPPNSLQIQSVVSAEYYRNVARVGLQAAQALQYAHAHDTLHRDVKPGNLLLDAEGCVWMADFGLAKAVENDSVTNSGDVVGTLAYVAPERFRGETTPRSDIYSLGLTLHEMLVLQRAFSGNDRVTIMSQVANERLTSPRRLNPSVPRDLETIVMKAASHDATDRYATAGEMADDLEAFLADRPIRARQLSTAEHTIRWCRRNRLMAGLAASVMILLATVFGVTLAGYSHAERQRHESEQTSKLAVSVLDEIYTRFASSNLSVPVSSNAERGEEELLGDTALPLSKDVAFMLDNLLHFYDEFSHQTNDSDLVVVKSIAANGRVGDIRRRLGELAQAQRSYEEAIKRIDQLSEAVRDSEAVRLESARIHNGLGIALQEDHRRKEAVTHHQHAIALLDHDGASQNEQFELAKSLYLLHRNRNKDEPNHEGLDRAIEILNELEGRHPNRPEYRFALARCLLADRSGCGSNGALNESQAKAIRIFEDLVKQSPDNPEYQFELGDTYRSIEWDEFRRHRRQQRDPEQLSQSVTRLRRGLDVTANLEVRHPNILQYNLSRKGLHHLLASALKEQGKLAEASDEYSRAILKQRLVVSQASDPHRHEFWLRHVELSYGKLLRDLGKTEEARTILNATAKGLENLIERPEIQSSDFFRPRTEQTLGKTYVTLANIEKSLGHAECAQELLRNAEETGS